MTTQIRELAELLKMHGYNVTNQRQVVFGVLQKQVPLSMSELFALTKQDLDRASLYRTIALFEQLGVVHRINIGWKYKLELSDTFTAHHHHLVCLNCGKVIDIQDEKHIDNFIQDVAKRFNFVPRKHQFEIDGYCIECQTQI